MCRIVGFLDLNYKQGYSIDQTILNMRDTLAHSGPDDAGVYLDKDIPLAFGHRRLSVIDLSPLGHQPMEFENLVITYNGEVYNFREIRQELEKEGYRFISNSDTEVILKAFHRWGVHAVQKFRGMFAGVSKYILRKVLYKYVPKELLDRPKQGFGVPIYEWFKGELKELYREYLNEHRIRSAGIFDSMEVKRLLDDYFLGKGVNHNKLWLLFVFELWREKWM